MTTTLHWVPVQELGSFFAMQDGTLLQCPMNNDGSRGDDSESCEVMDLPVGLVHCAYCENVLGVNFETAQKCEDPACVKADEAAQRRMGVVTTDSPPCVTVQSTLPVTSAESQAYIDGCDEPTREQRALELVQTIARMNWDEEERPDGTKADISADDYHETMISLIESARDIVEGAN